MNQDLLDNLPNMIIVEMDKSKNILNYYPFNNETNNKLKNIDMENFKLNKNYKVVRKELETKDIYYFQEVFQYEQTLNELHAKKEKLQTVFDLASNGISILDVNGMFLYANKFFQEMMGYSMDELYKESCISLSSKEYTNESKTAVQKAIQYGSVKDFRKVCVTKEGVHLNASMSLSYLESTNEIVMITSDITQDIVYQDKLKEQIEQEVSKRAEQYEIMFHQSRLASMGEMIDSIAHQWRQPLNSLGIIVQGLRHLGIKKEIDINFLQEIEIEIMEKIIYMSQTIDDFSTFFRISKDKEEFDIVKSINDALRLLKVQLQAEDIGIQVKVKKDLNTNIFGFANEFRQVILNIIHNSMMAILSSQQVNAKINISIDAIKNNISIIIQDNGGGIKKESLPKVFDPYFTTKDKGSGIGLYMSKMIIEHHMGGLLKLVNKDDGVQCTILLEQ